MIKSKIQNPKLKFWGRKIIWLVLMTFIFWQPAITKADTLSDLEQRQADLNRQITNQLNQLNSQKRTVSTIQDMVNGLDAQISLTQKQIDAANNQIEITTKQIEETTSQIEQKQKELDTQKENLFESVRVMYETPQQSTVEIVVGSNSLSEIVDRAQYIESLQYQIETTMNAITQLKSQLESQRNQLEQERNDLQNQKNSLLDKKKNFDIQQGEKSRLLSQASAEKSQMQSTLQATEAERDNVSAEIYALRKQRGDFRGGSTSYPYAGYPPDQRDEWGFYTRECTSYAAWYWNDVLGKSWYNTRIGSGSAWNWPALASDQGYSVISSPRVGAIVSWPAGGIFGGYGHVAIVEAVNGDGTFEVSQYNWQPFSYSEMHVGPDLASSARFIW